MKTWVNVRIRMSKNVVSVVIPTLNRPKYLKRIFRSLLAQTRLPDEVIIVDQSDNSETENLIIKERPTFSSENVDLKYIWEKTKSITHARNVGIRAASGEIVFFFDDDMILNKRYINEILNVYCEHPDSIGVQGLLIEKSSYWRGISTRSLLKNSMRKIFLLTHWEKDTQKVLPSGDEVVPLPLTKTIEAEIIFPALSSFNRELVKDFYFDENLKGYSWGEEYFTMKLNLQHQGSLYVTPFAKVIHKPASTARPTNKQYCYILTAYELYNFSKNLTSSLKSWIAFFWKYLGKIAIILLGFHRKENRMKLLYTLQSYLWTIRHFDQVKNGELNLV
jgi:glycosyltransferase involved in cell wall biosynthesis